MTSFTQRKVFDRGSLATTMLMFQKLPSVFIHCFELLNLENFGNYFVVAIIDIHNLNEFKE